MSTSRAKPSETIARFERTLENVSLFLVVFGAVGRDWVVGRLQAAANAVTKHNLPTWIAIYVAPPAKEPDELQFPPFDGIAACMDDFEPGAIDALIARAAGSEA